MKIGWLLSSALLGLTAASAAFGQTTRSQVIGYYAERHAVSGDYPLKQLATNGAAGLLTQLDYAFGKVAKARCEVPNPDVEINRAYSAGDSVDGTADSSDPNRIRGTFHQLQELKKKFPKLKIMISLGGWANSEGFSDAAQPANMRDFVRSCVDILSRAISRQRFMRREFSMASTSIGSIPWTAA